MTETSLTPSIRPLSERDFVWFCDLNERCVPAVNSLSDERLAALLARAAWTGVAEVEGDPLAVLVAFTKGSSYESANYGWFNQQAEAFVYIDRVMVEPAGRRLGLGRKLYQELTSWAEAEGQPRLCCEVYEVPPNPRSLAFHKSLGFSELTSRINPLDGTRAAMLERRL